MFFQPLKELTRFSLRSNFYSHIWLIPFVSLYFAVVERKKIFSDISFSPGHGIAVWLASLCVFLLTWNYNAFLNANDHAALATLSGILFFHGSFLFAYGKDAYRKALFPLLFLIFMIPIPSFLMDSIIDYLVAGSTEMTKLLFTVLHVPYVNQGNVFSLPGITIEVADVCSGIRSSLALIITICIANHMFLTTTWKKVVMFLAVVPMTILKNGIRIVTISTLAVYVDEKWLTDSFLHHSGGIFFFLPSLVLLGVLLWILRRTERNQTIQSS